jgi:outer membrane protein assembly factor BamB/PKD repeat protein
MHPPRSSGATARSGSGVNPPAVVSYDADHEHPGGGKPLRSAVNVLPGRRSLPAAVVLIVVVLLGSALWVPTDHGSNASPQASPYSSLSTPAPVPVDPGMGGINRVSGDPVTPLPDDWPMFMDGLTRDGANLNESDLSPRDAQNLSVLWKYNASWVIAATPVVADGTVYVGDWSGNETALNESTGEVEWQTNLGTTYDANCSIYSQGITSTPTIEDGTLYVGGGGPVKGGLNYWYALNAATGQEEWNISTGFASVGDYNWGSPLIYNGYAYIGTASDCDEPLIHAGLWQVNLTSHQILHYFNTTPPRATGSSIWSSPSLDPLTNTIFVTTGNGPSENRSYADQAIALNATTLAVVSNWSIPAGPLRIMDGDFGATPTVFHTARGQTLVEATDKDGWAYAWNASDLNSGPLWMDDVAKSSNCPECGGGSVSSAAFDGTTLFVAGGKTNISLNGGPENQSLPNYAGGVRAVDPLTGAYLWQHAAPGAVIAPLTYADGLVIDGAGNTLEVLDAANGTPLFTYTFPRLDGVSSVVYGAASVADGCIFASGSGLPNLTSDKGGEVVAFGLPGSSCQPPIESQWTHLSPSDSPSPRYGGAAATGPSNGSSILFGGENGTGFFGDTWGYRQGVWTPLTLSTAPGARSDAALAYDPEDNSFLLFGGHDATTTFGDTWMFANGTWTQLTPAAPPPPRSGAALGYDPPAHELVLFGGLGDSGVLGDTWAFANGQWTPLSPGPPARTGATLVYDAADGYLLLTGGENGQASFSDSWSFGAAGWSPLAPNPSPAPRAGAAGAYDPVEPGLVYVDGELEGSSGTQLFNQTWEYSGGDWALAVTPTAPSARLGAAGFYDAGEGVFVLFGGLAGTTPLGDTWIFQTELSVFQVASSPAHVDAGVSAQFTATIHGGLGPFTYQWSFGDGTTSAEASPEHTFSAPGNYTLNLTVQNPNGSATISELYSVHADPTVALVIRPPATDVDANTSFQADVTGGWGPYTYTYAGLPTACSGANAEEVWCAPGGTGTFHPSVSILDASGLTALSAAVSLTVNPVLVMTVASSTTHPLTGHRFWLNVSISGGTPDFTYSYSELPLGCPPANVSSLSCIPAVPGDYVVTVSVLDSAGVTVSQTVTLSVTSHPPSAAIGLKTLLEVGGGIGAGLLILLAVAMWYRRRSRRPRLVATPAHVGAETAPASGSMAPTLSSESRPPGGGGAPP